MRHEFKGWEEEEVMVSVMQLSVLFCSASSLPVTVQAKIMSVFACGLHSSPYLTFCYRVH